jgi:U3 small nucleolar RNA-associated protein 10
VGDLLSLAGSFGNGEDYSAYMEAYVTPCLTALATAVTKDVLWKPLNHKLLMLTRDKRRHVKVAAIRTLQQLFIEVGEEYLILMPECLPFVSELLESDNQDVLNATVDLVKDIESLSGEKLDQYLN